MRTTNTNFDSKHNLSYKTPMYLVHFDSETTDYCNHQPGSPDNSLKQYLVSISGLANQVTPEEGRSSIGGIQVILLDYNNEITSLLATDTYFFHRRKTTIKVGYLGMDEADMLTVFVGWVTGLRLSSDGTAYIFNITDPQKWMQRKIFRNATDSSTVTLTGNPINILLGVLTSTGNGTNGDYDWYAEENGLGLDTSYLSISEIEKIRDNYFPGDSHYMQFTIDDKEVAKKWIEEQIFKPLNIYPIIDGQGRFSILPFKPPLAALDEIQVFTEDELIGLPKWDANLETLINEIEFSYDYTDGDFLTEVYYYNADSINNRGPGKKPLTIKSKGLRSSNSGSLASRIRDIIQGRKSRIYGRWATPPTKITLKSFFSRWLTEAGDIVPFTHSKLPDIILGSRGYSEERMEVINRAVDWKRGEVSVTLLDTGFARETYQVISPTMTITGVTSQTNFEVSSADASKYINLTNPEVQIYDSKMRQKVNNITITSITSDGNIVCDSAGITLQTGWIVSFADYSNCTDEQKKYGFIASKSNFLNSSTSGLAGYWPFDKGSGSIAYDLSGKGNDGTLNGPSWTDGVIRNALSFDGTNDIVTTPLTSVKPITMTAWIYIVDYPSGDGFIIRNNRALYFFIQSNGTLRFHVYGIDETYNALVSTFVLNKNQWYHVVASYDGTTGSDSQKLYIDGVLDNSNAATSTGYNEEDNVFTIGAQEGGTNPFEGKIDEVRIYSRVLTETEISNLYNDSGCLSTGLVGYWPFDEGKNSLVQDYSGNENDLNLYNVGDSNWVEGKFGKCINLNGTNEYGEVNHAGDLDFTDSDLSISAWIHHNGADDWRGIVHNSVGQTTTRQFGFALLSTDLLVFMTYDGVSWETRVTSTVAVDTLGFHHVAVIFDDSAGTAKLYLDGEEVGSASGLNSMAYSPTWLTVGCRYGGAYFDGKIDEVRIYNKVLTTTEITNLYNNSGRSHLIVP